MNVCTRSLKSCQAFGHGAKTAASSRAAATARHERLRAHASLVLAGTHWAPRGGGQPRAREAQAWAPGIFIFLENKKRAGEPATALGQGIGCKDGACIVSEATPKSIQKRFQIPKEMSRNDPTSSIKWSKNEVWRRSLAALGAYQRVLVVSWAVLGVSWGVLWPSWAASWSDLGVSWSCLGSL